MIEIEILKDEDLEVARDRFSEMCDTRQLLRSGDPAAGVISASRLYAYANSTVEDAEIETELSRSLSVRRAYRKYLETAAIYRPGIAVAANTEAIPPRRGVGCTVRVEPSRVEPDQYIVIVEIQTPPLTAEASPATLILCDTEDHCHRFALPPAHRGVIQFIIAEDAEMLTLLRDPRIEALLR
jgi:hypothetical protein